MDYHFDELDRGVSKLIFNQTNMNEVEVMEYYNAKTDVHKVYIEGFEFREGVQICPTCDKDYKKCEHEVEMTAKLNTNE